MKERRTQPRFDVEELFEARLNTNGQVETGRVIDLNNAGAFIATDLVLERGTRLEVELKVPEMEPMSILALVARRSEQVEGRTKVIPGGLGVVFVAGSLAEREFIQNAVMQALRSSARSSGNATPMSGLPSRTPLTT